MPTSSSQNWPMKSVNQVAYPLNLIYERRWFKRYFTMRSDPVFAVPWDMKTTIVVMVAWFIVLYVLSTRFETFAWQTFRLELNSMASARSRAIFFFLRDLGCAFSSMLVVFLGIRRYRPLPKGLFPFRLKGKWPLGVVSICLVLFPILSQDLTGGAAFFEAGETPDAVAVILNAITICICCPAWEEILFRGFLLPSLCRYLPVAASIVVSSVLFALVHVSIPQKLPLMVIGLITGTVFVVWKNLFASIFAHVLWNTFIYTDILLQM
ncbi:hypothetical protein CYMTET_24360 [Cymbomonas tetramitiformis]|uniref:CAAX prenyl protease 2/Lysostaphin resistance protein A-like domain-containing protein n=1 Tax=Cymbomonas tetramitiformis TaxID=36881 RepID=A0AAE0FWJ7_9CHLO|nr:hypothetical protein CYMTET_24360 [Cymbomonas tetramitiformis]